MKGTRVTSSIVWRANGAGETSVRGVRLDDFVDPTTATAPKTSTQYVRRHYERLKQKGMVQLARLYVTPSTRETMKYLVAQWGFKNRGQMVETALRLLEKQTREGLERIEL